MLSNVVKNEANNADDQEN